VGAMAGLFSWSLTVLVAALPVQPEPWISDLVPASALGAFVGGLTIYFSDRWAGNRVLARWVISGTIIGLVAGAIAGLGQIPIGANLSPKSPTLARLVAWMLTGALIGIGLGLRWLNVNRLRVVHACTGGLLGGAMGGFIFSASGSRIPDLSQALGFVSVGVGICFGITLAPILLRDGLLQFISSGDARAQGKFGRGSKQWEVQQGDSYVIGSMSQDLTRTAYRPDVQVYIPDASIAPRHAVLVGRDGRFFLARHPETGGQAGLARFVLRVRGKTISASHELRDDDDILIGRTALKFVSRDKNH